MDCLFKDFATPFATVFASLVAVGVTGYFAWRQSNTAETQAVTALDKLRFDLHDKRFAIYENVKQLLKLLINNSDKPEFRTFDVAQHFVVIDEAIFFFSPATCEWLDSLKVDCQRFLEARALRSNPAEYKPTECAQLQIKLVDHFKAMPERFRQELGFRQLTQNPQL